MKKLLLFLPLYFLSTSFTYSQVVKHPNILWVTIEDTSPEFIGCYGNKDARTPNIDALAKDGVKFTNAFSTGTVCAPSRSTIITGVRTFKMGTGNHRSKYPIPDFIQGFPYYLQKAGYYTTNNSKTDYNIGNTRSFIRKAWNESSNTAGWWNRKPGQPFFAVFNYMDSHQSRTMTFSYSKYEKVILDKLPVSKRIGENSFRMPPFYKNSSAMRKQFARVYNSIERTDIEIGLLLDSLKRDHLMDSTIIFFYADHGEGEPRGKTNGTDLGYRVPFVAWFPPMYKNLSPWGTGGVVTNELVDFEDLAPTILSMAGAPIPSYLEGRRLIGKDRSKPVNHLILSSDRSDNGIDMVRSITNGRFTYNRNYLPFMPELRYIRYMEIGEIKQQMRTDNKKGNLNKFQSSLFKSRSAESLYDYKNDPWETHNLINDPQYKTLVSTMKKTLDSEVLKARDVMFLPEYEEGIISKKTTSYIYRLNDKNYPIKTIYAAASLSGFRGHDIAQKQVKLLKSNNKVVRYWAILGLRSQSPNVLKNYKNEIVSSMQDSYPPVIISAAAIAFDVFKNTEAESLLKKYSQSDNMDLALLAINYLLYVKNKEPFIEDIKKVHDLKGRDYNVKTACLDFLGSLGLVPNNTDYSE